MECNELRLLLAFRRPGGPSEFSPEDAAALDKHLAGCPACATALARENRFDSAVSVALQSVPVPVDLKARLLTSALAQQGAEWRRAITKSCAVAVGVFAVLYLGSGLYWYLRPPFPTDQVADDMAAAIESPEQLVQAWLKKQNFPADLPREFDYRHYDNHGTAPVGDRDVPFISFVRQSDADQRIEKAKVFIARSGRFDLKAMKKEAQNSFVNVIVIMDEKNGIAYIIGYTSATLEPFLKKVSRHEV